MRKLALKVWGTPVGGKTPHDGKFIKKCDFEVPAGMLALDSTSDPKEALLFDDLEQAMAYWKTRSTLFPTRPWDGQPNCPLLGVNVATEPVEVPDV